MLHCGSGICKNFQFPVSSVFHYLSTKSMLGWCRWLVYSIFVLPQFYYLSRSHMCLFVSFNNILLKNNLFCFPTPDAVIIDNTNVSTNSSKVSNHPQNVSCVISQGYLPSLHKGKSHWGEMPKRSPNWFRRVVESMPQTQYRAKRKKYIQNQDLK